MQWMQGQYVYSMTSLDVVLTFAKAFMNFGSFSRV